MATLVVASFMVMSVLAATDPTVNIALSRNEVARSSSGERTKVNRCPARSGIGQLCQAVTKSRENSIKHIAPVL